jgi:hypothetical protein
LSRQFCSSGLVGDYITWMIVDFDALALALS